MWKIDESVHDQNPPLKILVFSFSFQVGLGSYIACIDKFAFKKIEALIRHEVVLYL